MGVVALCLRVATNGDKLLLQETHSFRRTFDRFFYSLAKAIV